MNFQDKNIILERVSKLLEVLPNDKHVKKLFDDLFNELKIGENKVVPTVYSNGLFSAFVKKHVLDFSFQKIGTDYSIDKELNWYNPIEVDIVVERFMYFLPKDLFYKKIYSYEHCRFGQRNELQEVFVDSLNTAIRSFYIENKKKIHTIIPIDRKKYSKNLKVKS
jgi:hypothetical protein